MSDSLTTTVERGASVRTACADQAQGGRAVRSMELLGHVTVLFVMKDSLYKSLGLDCYDVERNALTYAGNNPVVAHPPCQLWGKMAVINHKQMMEKAADNGSGALCWPNSQITQPCCIIPTKNTYRKEMK